MDTKPLLYGLIGFIAGGLLVSVAATTFDKPQPAADNVPVLSTYETYARLKGDDYDRQFIAHMIDHHQDAIDMARSAAANARHQEVKDLAEDIIQAQSEEIDKMKDWQKDWGYAEQPHGH